MRPCQVGLLHIYQILSILIYAYNRYEKFWLFGKLQVFENRTSSKYFQKEYQNENENEFRQFEIHSHSPTHSHSLMRRERATIFDAVLANPRRFDLLCEVFDHGIK
jgi:nuclear transport factor 2 (NTF2) superfamily protein